jgi:molybdopterin converting factor small subunit
MVVYHRQDHRRGKVTAGNQFTGTIAVQWDDGSKQILPVSELMSEKLYNEFKEEERLEQMSIKPEQCVIGTIVFLNGKSLPLRRGTIVGLVTPHPTPGDIVIVEYDDGRIDKTAIKSLLSEVDGLAEQTRLEEVGRKLEEEFAKVEAECTAKLNEAAELIREAGKLADDKGVDLQEMYDATRGIERAMDAAGWRTSSWHC